MLEETFTRYTIFIYIINHIIIHGKEEIKA